ncbi:MAG: decaprenyl-phosphate phosphoribosyltransferase [Acidobacteriota bacterium]|nr:MAG: decaprenyl-phosphate phosphoribosyltransferase [Acidobacteriota bacterium]
MPKRARHRDKKLTSDAAVHPPGVIEGVVRSLRPHQWVKNVLLFAALVFSQKMGDVRAVLLASAGFVIFCLLSSFVYLVNDVLDREHDRLHPVKRYRPIASGVVPLPVAVGLAVVLLVAGLAGAVGVGRWFLLTALAYALLSLAYCFALKKIVILDVMVLAVGYTLRAVAGAEAIAVEFSDWLLLCTTLLALFLGFCKRRQELTSLRHDAVSHRSVLAGYTEPFLDQMIAVVTASTVVAYMFYALSDDVAAKLGTPYLGLTVPFVLYGIFRYFYLVHVRGGGGRPSRELMTDKPLVINVLLYGLTVIVLLYLLPAASAPGA